MPVSIKILIPVERSGYTGRFNQHESYTNDHLVEVLDDGRVQLTEPNTSMKRAVAFDLDDLKAALDALKEAERK